METLSNKEMTQKSYQATAQAFADNVADLAPIESMEKFINLLPQKPKVIDIGCGSGRDAKIFSNMNAQVLGIDFSSNLLDIATRHAPLAEFKLMDIENIDLPSSSFDGAWSACSLAHIPKNLLPEVLTRIHSLLKADGYFYLALKKGLGEVLEEDLRYGINIKKFWSFYQEEELKNMLQNASFKILEFDTVEKHHAYLTHAAFRIFCQKI